MGTPATRLTATPPSARKRLANRGLARTIAPTFGKASRTAFRLSE